MKILFDHQAFTFQKFGGISRYFYEMIVLFNKRNDISVSTPSFLSSNHYISDKKNINHIRFLPDNEFRGKVRILFFLNEFISTKKLKKQNFDIFHPTYYDTYFLDHLKNKPFVVTVYDMVHEKFPDMLPPDSVTQNKRCLCEKASKIIAISESTKKDLIELFNIEESKIEVIYLSNSIVVDGNIELDTKVPKNYILFVGSRGGYKNFNRFISAVSLLMIEHSDLSIVCVGGGDFNNQELSLFNELGIRHSIFQFNINDRMLAQIYSNALMFVFPSLYEGFGIPVLESFACNCPLVCSDTSSLPEIAGAGAEYFDPYDEESIYMAVKKVFNSDEEKYRLVKNGKERLKDFSWEKTAEQTYEIYESIMR